MKAIVERLLFTELPPNYDKGQQSIDAGKEVNKVNSTSKSTSYYLMLGIIKLKDKAMEAQEKIRDINIGGTLISTGNALKDKARIAISSVWERTQEISVLFYLHLG